MSVPRMNKEKADLTNANYVVEVDEGNNQVWNIFIAGPQNSPFEGHQFVVQLKFESFPFKGPLVQFITKIYHPNVNEKGEICADMLGTADKWAPATRLVVIMDRIKSLLVAPNVDTPLNQKAAKDFKDKTWFENAKAHAAQNAK